MKINLYVNIILVLLFVELLSCQKIDVPKGTLRWVKKKIRIEQKHFIYVSEYSYYGQDIFLFKGDYCEVPSYLFDHNGVLICEPDGGEFGMGDGKCLDFYTSSIIIKKIWKK
jgi:hypothetical protein